MVCKEYSTLRPLKEHHSLRAKNTSRSERRASDKAALGFDFLCFAKRTYLEQGAT